MREIEFRGKRIQDNEWVYGFYSQFHNRPVIDEPNSHQIFEVLEDKKSIRIAGTAIGGVWHIVDNNTISQYTGLKDANGRKIFEGDIIVGDIPELLDSKNLIGVVEYEESSFVVRFINRQSWEIQRVGFCSFNNYKIIGNKFDNKELMCP